jgi:hypothetical protein
MKKLISMGLVIFCLGCATPFGTGVAGVYPPPESDNFATLDIGRKYHVVGTFEVTYFNLNGQRVVALGVNEGYRIKVDEGVHDICISPSSDMREECFVDQPAGEFAHPIKGRSLLMLNSFSGVVGVKSARYCYEAVVLQFYEIPCEEWDERYSQITLVN